MNSTTPLRLSSIMAERRFQTLRSDQNLARFLVNGSATGRQLGSGSYGSVEEIEVNGLICAGKKIHEALLDAGNVGVQDMASKYVQECQLMSDLRHPNITLFLGVCFLPNCPLPVLLMERLDGSLDELLETLPNVPLVLKRSLFEDVAKGLLYLHKHEPQIVHRDLTAKNVLLTSSLVAKITDFGNSRIVSLQPGQLARTLSSAPGTLVYMPPEALSDVSRYGPSLDVFSFGHLALFTLTQTFPGQLLEPNYTDPENLDRLVGRSEVERREQYFQLLDRRIVDGQRHPCVQLTKECLHNSPSRRPTAEQLVATLEGMRADIEGPCGAVARADAVRQVVLTKDILNRESEVKKVVDQVTERDSEIQRLQQQLQENDSRWQTRLAQMTLDLEQKDSELRQTVSQMGLVRDKLTQLQESTDAMLQEKSAEIDQLQLDLESSQAKLQQFKNTVLSELQLPSNLVWRRGQDMPYEMNYHPGAIVSRGKVYVAGGSTDFAKSNTVMVYNIQRDNWAMLPQYSFKWFTMGVVRGQLVLVGGVDPDNKRTNELGVWNERAREWTHPYPPMPTRRSGAAVITHTTADGTSWLVVAGGYSEECTRSCSKVEILDASTKQWYYSTLHLPIPMCKMSSAVIGNRCYLLGGLDHLSMTTILQASLDNLIFLTILRSARGATSDSLTSNENGTESSDSEKDTPWQVLCESPSERCIVVAVKGALMAIGGSTIYLYKSSSQSWEKVGTTLSDRKECACTVLPNGELFVVGGYTHHVDICRTST